MSHVFNLSLEILVIWSWLALILLMCDRLAAGERPTSLCELGERLHWQHRRAMVLGSAVVSLVNGHGGVDDLRLYGLLVDDWLHGFVDVMVDMLPGGDGESCLSVLSLVYCGGVLEFSGLSLQTFLRLALVVVVELAVFNGDHVMGMLLGQYLLMLQGLHGCVVVVLVDFTVNSLCDILMTSGLDSLGGDGRVDDLLDVGLVAMSACEIADGGFGRLHCDDSVGINVNDLSVGVGVDYWVTFKLVRIDVTDGAEATNI